jgi:hypothetical protein
VSTPITCVGRLNNLTKGAIINNLENFNISDDLVLMLKDMLIKDPAERASSFDLLNKYRQKFMDHNDVNQASNVKYSPVQTISRIDLTVENSKEEVKRNIQKRKYNPEMNLSNRNKIK